VRDAVGVGGLSIASLLTADGALLYETKPWSNGELIYVQKKDTHAFVFLCPEHLLRTALTIGHARFEASGDGLGWYYPRHLRPSDDGNERQIIEHLNVAVRSEPKTLLLDVAITLRRAATDSDNQFVISIKVPLTQLLGFVTSNNLEHARRWAELVKNKFDVHIQLLEGPNA
jgi:hypothetical protein